VQQEHDRSARAPSPPVVRQPEPVNRPVLETLFDGTYVVALSVDVGVIGVDVVAALPSERLP